MSKNEDNLTSTARATVLAAGRTVTTALARATVAAAVIETTAISLTAAAAAASITTNSTTTSNNNTTEPLEAENKFVYPWYQQVIWSLLFASMITIAAGGNIIVIWIVITHKKMRTVTNYFIVNLSVADTMVSLFNVLFNFIYMLNSNWPFGEVCCKMSQFISVLSVTSSVLTLMAISIDRYLTLCDKLSCLPQCMRVFSLFLSFPLPKREAFFSSSSSSRRRQLFNDFVHLS